MLCFIFQRSLEKKFLEVSQDYSYIMLIGVFGILDKASVPRGTGAIICLRNELCAIDGQNLIIPAWMI